MTIQQITAAVPRKSGRQRTGKKQKMIQEIQNLWHEMPEKNIALICSKYEVSRQTVRKYIQMSAEVLLSCMWKQDGTITQEKIAEYVGLSIEEVRKLKGEEKK